MKDRLFISSVQKELAVERRALKEYVHGDPLLRRFFEVFLFEDVPASDRRADQVYLEQVDRSAIYLGLFGDQYGFENRDGLSPTEREFDRASDKGKIRLIFVKGSDDAKRQVKMRALIHRAGEELIRRRFTGVPDLQASLYASLIDYLQQRGSIHQGPFDAAACSRATFEDIADDRVRQFVATARRERQYSLAERTPTVDVLEHLNLLDRRHPSHAAVLLFGNNPQRFLPSSEVKCMHFHGTEVRKPVPSYQIYKGAVFALVDQAVDFVLSKIARSVGTREDGPQAPVTYELPKQAVTEAIVNAVAHRDYSSNASVQVSLFSHRLEVWNPGELPPVLTPERLRHPHASIPRNPLIADPLFLVRYVEKAGTGILDAIALCRSAGLPEPDFRQDGGQFVMTLWRDWLTPAVLAGLQLNERQLKAVAAVRLEHRLTTARYQAITETSRATAQRDLEQLVAKGVLAATGAGRGAGYELRTKRLKKASIASSDEADGNASKTPQSPHAAGRVRKQALERRKKRIR